MAFFSMNNMVHSLLLADGSCGEKDKPDFLKACGLLTHSWNRYSNLCRRQKPDACLTVFIMFLGTYVPSKIDHVVVQILLLSALE